MKDIRVPFVDLRAQHAPLRQALLSVVGEALDRAAFIGGEPVAAFEAAFAAFTAARHCVGVGSGTEALRLCLQAAGVGPGDTVVTVPNTFIATAEAITMVGARIAFVDVLPTTRLMDPERLEALIGADGPPPKAVIPVHLYGQCAAMDPIAAIVARQGCLVIEDAAQAHGATYRGRPAGSLGLAAGFSFYPGKNLGACGEAGAVTTSDDGLADRVRRLRDHGQARKYHHDLEGTNARLDAIQAGFLRCKLPHLQEWNRRRRAVADAYDQAFADLPGIEPVAVAEDTVSSRHLYVVHCARRDALRDYLADQGIQTGLHYPVPLHLQPCYRRLGHGPGDFPVAEASAARLLSLPIFAEMRDEQVALVVEAIRRFAELVA